MHMDEHDEEYEEEGLQVYTKEQLLANMVEATYREFAYLPDEHAYTACTLWVLHTHLRSVTGEFLPYVTPRLYFGSNRAGCGKSLVTELTTRMSYNGRMVLEPTPPSITTMINQDMATPGFDEIDLYFGKGRGQSSMRAILNGGYKKGNAVTRQRSDEVDWQNCHAPVVLNGKNANLFLNSEKFETLRSRSIAVVLERKPKNHYLSRWNPELHEGRLHHLARRLKRWGEAHARKIVKIDVEDIIPEPIQNRDREIWTVLFRISEHLGGDWPERCASAAKAFVLGDHEHVEDETFVNEYEELRDAVRECFAENEEFIPTIELLDRLSELEEPPQIMTGWVGFQGHAQGLSNALSVFGVKHARVQIDGEQSWGYTRRSLGLGPAVKLTVVEEEVA